jgi:hypothetical protein
MVAGPATTSNYDSKQRLEQSLDVVDRRILLGSLGNLATFSTAAPRFNNFLATEITTECFSIEIAITSPMMLMVAV